MPRNAPDTTTEQLDFFKPTTKLAMEAFLTHWIELEEEEDRLREAKRTLKEHYAEDFSMRALLTAVKVCRAKLKLEQHEKEPMPRVRQVFFEHFVDHVLMARQQEKEATQQEAERLARAVPDLTADAG